MFIRLIATAISHIRFFLRLHLTITLKKNYILLYVIINTKNNKL